MWQLPDNHIRRGCPQCGKERGRMLNKMKQRAHAASKFMRNAASMHNHKYDYSKVNYVNSYTKVAITCPIHGSFDQLPAHHVQGAGCPVCSRIVSNSKKRKKTSTFIREAQFIHGDKYDYSMAKYIGAFNKIKIICPVHGMFEQIASDHLKGHGCPKCAWYRSNKHKFIDTDEFVRRARSVHGDKYDYSKVDYNRTVDEVTIVCPNHGPFIQLPKNHMQGRGCHKCFIEVSSGHQELYDFISQLCPDAELNNREQISPYELDIFVPSKMIAIEYNGNYWHSYSAPETRDQILKHQTKHLMCLQHGIQLIQIPEHVWSQKRPIVRSMLTHAMGLTDMRIYARNTNAVHLTNRYHVEFMNNNHVYGHGRHASYVYGLSYESDIVSVMSFNKISDGYEINRFATKLNTHVVGGGGKLLSAFIRDMDPRKIITYADAMYGVGNIYKGIGFDCIKLTRPNYVYVRAHDVYSRHKCQKHKLKDTLKDFDQHMTEAENMFHNGYRRLWDAGHYKFIYER
jgi:ssDNA-binding Zn-finger/Zn-ribbon topoisomerase 1